MIIMVCGTHQPQFRAIAYGKMPQFYGDQVSSSVSAYGPGTMQQIKNPVKEYNKLTAKTDYSSNSTTNAKYFANKADTGYVKFSYSPAKSYASSTKDVYSTNKTPKTGAAITNLAPKSNSPITIDISDLTLTQTPSETAVDTRRNDLASKISAAKEIVSKESAQPSAIIRRDDLARLISEERSNQVLVQYN